VNTPTRVSAQVSGFQALLTRRLWVVVAAVLAMVVTAWLGAWQLRRAATKEALAQSILDKSSQEVLVDIAQAAINLGASGIASTQTIAPLLQRRVNIQGRWLHDHTVFLDNRYMDNRVGFYVVTPLQLVQAPANTVVWVQRGWVPRNALNRDALPQLPQEQGAVAVQGRLVESVSRVYALGDEASAGANTAARTSRIWQNLPQTSLGNTVTVLPFAVLQTAPETLAALPNTAADTATGSLANNLQRDWPAPDSGVAKHYGYAFQWFAMCAGIACLFIWFQLIAPRRRVPTT
jgi:surfeit locus 1 family protein